MSEHLTTPLSPRFSEATAYALDHHRTQSRKGTEIPYAAHLLAVAAIVLEMEASEDEAIAALLHDAVEDGGGPRVEAEIRERFGAGVIEIVLANSDSTVDTRVERKPPWRERKEAYIAAIATKPAGAVRVSIADKLHNAHSILADERRLGPALYARFSVGRDETLWYYAGLVVAFEARRDELGPRAGYALDDLRDTVAELRSRSAN